jgi:hypothetical protein
MEIYAVFWRLSAVIYGAPMGMYGNLCGFWGISILLTALSRQQEPQIPRMGTDTNDQLTDRNREQGCQPEQDCHDLPAPPLSLRLSFPLSLRLPLFSLSALGPAGLPDRAALFNDQVFKERLPNRMTTYISCRKCSNGYKSPTS